MAARPADAVANDYFRARRFIGSGDRRAVSDRVWRVLRTLSASGLVAGRRRDASPDGRRLAAAGGRQLRRAGSGILRWPLRARAAGTVRAGGPSPAGRPHARAPVDARRGAAGGAGLAAAAHLEPAELRALLEPAPLDLRVNLLKATREEARAALAAEGLEATPTPHSPWGLRIEGRRQVTAGAAFRAGLVEIQDEGSQLVAAQVDARPGMRVADLCAGAGGKTLALAMMMQNRGQLVACDVSATRLDGAVRRLRRAGVHNVERHLLEPGDKWIKRRAKTFDRVLVDAPCTGTGTWRRNPDARLRLTEADLAELLPKQAAILDQAASLVRTGGRLVYATCSLLPEENEAQVTAFLARHPGFTQGEVLRLRRPETAPTASSPQYCAGPKSFPR